MRHNSSSRLNQLEEEGATNGWPVCGAVPEPAQPVSPSVRAEWSYRLASILQATIGDVMNLDGDDFEAPFRLLAGRVPTPVNVSERLILKSLRMEFALRIGDEFHVRYHRRWPGACRFMAIECVARVWFDASTDPRSTLTQWASAYADVFSRHHQLPAAWKAARVLLQRPEGRVCISKLAREVGVSRSSLVKGFGRIFGISPFEYHTRVRLRCFVRRLRESSDKVSCVGEEAGFRSAKVYRSLRKVTGQTPSTVRAMTPNQFDRMLNGPLQTDLESLVNLTLLECPR
jgi:AraC-like DNA-binding protein